MSELTSRQWKLYTLLESNPSHWFSQKEICDAIPEFHYIDDERNNCVDIGTEQRAINEAMTTDKIIITNKHCFKIATLEEYRKFRAKLTKRIKNAVAQVEAWDTKYERNGQCKLFNNVLNELNPRNEQYHETFVPVEEKKAEITKGKVVFINLVDRVAYIVSDVWEYTLNEETNIAYIQRNNKGKLEMQNIHEVISLAELERPFYEEYERKEI